ncbi:LysR family transcriptional regulator [Paenibacillus lignilyticus]|uniref:LysR family transcriptional regulator n=1 Tax=Paenibacillus lignilyticus TaxID=1172615 RepID=A0ABS5C709_9BACL|nr:LysR family transcriptional regulator [Paenibacillus lignilyticus]MBP3961635.1 LysR family transcriptional regulator [Paenibacillus lignilyticus]MBP3963695.1 LysR family transcriptional regulator [Paenibacillus lignilyticus]
MNILRLQILVLIERLRKVTAVADELGMKQPTVSFHMKKLEEEWGMPLFEMKTGKVMLTESGKLLYQYAEGIDRLYREAQERFASYRRQGKHQFVIGCTDAASSVLFSGNWYRLAEEASTLQINLITDQTNRLLEQLHTGKLDLIVFGDSPLYERELQGCQSELLLEDRLSLFTTKSHPLLDAQQGGTASSYLLQGQSYVKLADPSIEEAVSSWFAKEQLKLSSPLSTDRIDLALNAVRAGSLLALLPSSAALPLSGGILRLPLPGQQQSWKLVAAWRSDYWNPVQQQRMVALLKELPKLQKTADSK